MMIQKIYTFTICVITLLIICTQSACKKDDELMSAVPEIEFVSVTPTSLKEYSAPLSFTIKYRDGDGNLGENNADVKNLFLTDNRINVSYTYRIQQLAPDNTTIPIQGTLNIDLASVNIINSAASQTVTYSIYVVDRAGNKSNVVTSDVVTITK
jgi:hypothetical protein